MNDPNSNSGAAYRNAGVDIDLAQSLLQRVKRQIAATRRAEVLAPIGGFGGLFALDLSRYRQPVLVTSIDGVGTKLMVAGMVGRHDGVGHDLVNHCINDIAVQGATPLYFMDYLGIGKLRSPLYEQVLAGMAAACGAQNVALLGGETAEMPGMYGNDYDLVGCITGIVERENLISGARVRPGHVVIGLAANGLHTNGYSLARRVLFEQAGFTVDTVPPGTDQSLGEQLLRPHTCYWPAVRAALDAAVPVDAMAHITGGGLYDNLPRSLPDEVQAVCDPGVLPIPDIFRLIQKHGQVQPAEMYRVFNMGIGMVWVVAPEGRDAALHHCEEAGVTAAVIGEIVPGPRRVVLGGIDS